MRDTVTFSPLEWVRFESSANAEHAGGRLTIRLEQPDPLRLYLRFTYETTLPDGGAADGVDFVGRRSVSRLGAGAQRCSSGSR